MWLQGWALDLEASKSFSAEELGSSRRVFSWILAEMAQDWVGADVCCCFLFSLWQTAGLGTFNPPHAGPRNKPCTPMTRVGGVAVGHSMAWLILSQVCCFALSQHRA